MKSKRYVQFLKLLLQIIVAALAGFGGSSGGSALFGAPSRDQAPVGVDAPCGVVSVAFNVEPIA